MSGVTWKTHAGKKVLIADYRGTKGAETVALMKQVAKEVQAAPPGVLILTDVTGVALGPDFMAESKKLNEDVLGPRGAKLAMVGVDGIKALLLKGFNAVGKGAKGVPFPDEASALAHLVA